MGRTTKLYYFYRLLLRLKNRRTDIFLNRMRVRVRESLKRRRMQVPRRRGQRQLIFNLKMHLLMKFIHCYTNLQLIKIGITAKNYKGDQVQRTKGRIKENNL